MISSTNDTTKETTTNHNNNPPKPESVDKALASTIYKLHPVTKCLKESLNECIESDITIHQSFQSKLLNKYGESMVQAYQNVMSSNSTLKEEEGEEEEEVTGGGGGRAGEAHCFNNGKPTLATADHTPMKAPAALLTGNIQHYNRYEGNWRIIISDAILRPRIDIPYTDKSEANARKRTLFEHSAIVEIEQRLKRTKTNEEPPTRMHPLLPCIGDDGSIKLDGDVVILAYDDYVTSNKKK